MRMISPQGVELIKEHEGLRLKAYLCPAGVWTIGWGHTGPDVHPGLAITRAQAERLLYQDLTHFCAKIDALLRQPANANEFAAMVSLAFNIGERAFAKSTVLKRFNVGDKLSAARAFELWNKATDPATKKLVVMPGLERRRKSEAALFLTPDAATRLVMVEDEAAAGVYDTPAGDMPQAVSGEKSLWKSKELWGGIAGAASVPAADWIGDLQGIVDSVKGELYGLAVYLPYAKYALMTLTALGFGLIILSRIKERREGRR